MAYERVAKAILNAPWRNEEGGVEEEERNKRRKGKGKPKAERKPKGGERSDGGDSSRDPPGAPEAPGQRPKMGQSKILTQALAGAFRAMPKRTPKDRITRRSQVARLTIAHKSEASFRNRQGLRRALVKKLPKGTVGVATEHKLLDSDCESCKSRRGKATTSAAKAALAYAKKVRNKLEKMAHLPLMSEDERDDETEVEVEEEDPDADHVPLGGRGPEDPPDGVGTVFSLEGGGTGSVPSRKHPTMEVILDSGASHNVLPERVFWRLYEQGRATPLKKVSSPQRFSTASGESLPNLGTTEVYLSGTSPEGTVTRCKCNFNVAAVQRCLLSTGAMAQKNVLVFLGKEAVLFLPNGRSLLFPVRGSPRTTFRVLPSHPHRQRTA